jgi:uroporphyrinogen decarboxylase
MNSRERVLAALAHAQPDRIPIGLSFAPEVTAALCQRLGVEEAALGERLGEDLAGVRPTYPAAASPLRYSDPTIELTADGLYVDCWGVPFRPVSTGSQVYMELAGRPPLAGLRSEAELDAFAWPQAGAWDYANVPVDLAAHAAKATWGHSRGFFEIAHFMRGMENFLADLALRPALACALMDRIADSLLARARRTLEAGAGGFVLFEYNDDVAGQRGMFLSPAMWRRYIKPRVARFFELIRRHGAAVRCHCCGSCRPIIPDLIEIGMDVLNPVQPRAAGMDPFELKAEFGDQLTLHGGIDIQELLPNGSPEQVRAHVRRMIQRVGRGGGYILGPSHRIQADTPLENILAMVAEALGGS